LSRRRKLTTQRRDDEIVLWVLNTAARRVPNFVQELTGCKTKKELFVRFGPNCVFDRTSGSPRVYHLWNESLVYDPRRGRADRIRSKKEPPPSPGGVPVRASAALLNRR
jgi:hypothetical protein